MEHLITFFVYKSRGIDRVSLASPKTGGQSVVSVLMHGGTAFIVPSFDTSITPIRVQTPFVSAPVGFLSRCVQPDPAMCSPHPRPDSEAVKLSFLGGSQFRFPFVSGMALSTARWKCSGAYKCSHVSTGFSDFPFPVGVDLSLVYFRERE